MQKTQAKKQKNPSLTLTLTFDKKKFIKNKKVVSKLDKTFVLNKFSSKTTNKGEIKEKANCLMTDGRTYGRTDGRTDGRTQVNYRGASLLKTSRANYLISIINKIIDL